MDAREEDKTRGEENDAADEVGMGRKGEQGNGKSEDDAGELEKGKEKEPSIFGKIWKKLDLDVPTVLAMMKAGLPPTIVLAMSQADAVAHTYTTLGYLAAIISILSFCIMPRAKFLQTMIINVIAVCLSSALAMLQLWSAVQARHHTTPPGLLPQRYRYNSSQSAVCGVWMFFEIWLFNTCKAKYPQFAIPCVVVSIFAGVASTSGATFQTTAQVEKFVQTLLQAFLTGFAVATGVSLFVLPLSCRTVVTKQMTGYVGALRGALKAHKGYFESMETKDIFRQMTHVDGKHAKKEKMRPEIAAVKGATAALTQVYGKLNADLPFAKREVAYGKLTPDDFESIFKNLRAVMMPLISVASIIDIFERLSELHVWENAEDRQNSIDDWHRMMNIAHEPLQNILDTMDQGLEHVCLRLQFTKLPKRDKKNRPNETDAEAKGELVKPGDKDFAAYFKNQSDEFYAGRCKILRFWLEWKGIKVDDDLVLDSETEPELRELGVHNVNTRDRTQRQLFLALYLMFLLNSVSVAVLDFVKWADEHDQATAKKRFMTPGKKRFKKWISSMFTSQDSHQDDEATNVGLTRTDVVVHMGEAYKGRKDPEHMEPANAWEKFGNSLRKVPDFLRSSESVFGFRVACGSMSVGIVAYLADTQLWFTRQRVVWAMLMVVLSMTPTSGLAMFNFIMRIGGTLIAMLCAWLVWYIPDQKTPGILVFLWVFISAGHWVPLKRLDLLIAGLISMVTVVLIIGYELQVRKLGVAAAEASGQPYYKILVLGPYRLAAVTVGIAIAFFWTFFPFPITEHSTLRTKLGGALYLSANLYSIMHETVMARIRGDGGDPADKSNPSYQLLKVQNKVFAKQMLTLQALRQHSAMVNYEFPLGGKFPKKEYDAIISCVANITNYSALLGLASREFLNPSLSLLPAASDPSNAHWFHSLRRLVLLSKPTSHDITSLLSLLSSSVTNAVPLPPYLASPPRFELTRKLEDEDPDILSMRHVAEPGYAAFAVVQVGTRCIQMDTEKLLGLVRGLVGELDFSYHVVSTREGSESGLSQTVSKGEERSKQD